MVSKISRTERHIRWNWQKSPDLEKGVRYHFVVVDDKKRGETLDMILGCLQSGGAIEEVRTRIEGEVKSSKNKYLFSSFDSLGRPDLINWTKIGKPVVKDGELYERKSNRGIEEYVEKLYSGE